MGLKAIRENDYVILAGRDIAAARQVLVENVPEGWLVDPSGTPGGWGSRSFLGSIVLCGIYSEDRV